ncbi:MAG: hypothetical protein H7X93_04525, partial [Sphingomonadaceae bacterium]|nr:hypothetical protein [Sphingomonadaceae bacterium]
AAWDRALDTGRARMFDAAIDRALNGVTTFRLRLGGVIHIEHGPDRRLMMSALRAPPPPAPKRTECT